MQRKHAKRTERKLLPRVLTAVILMALVSVGSVITVMANTVTVQVYDEGEVYEFSILGNNPEDILKRATEQGMPALETYDTYDFSGGALTVRRGVQVSVSDSGAVQLLEAYHGTALSTVLSENGVTLGVRDLVEPAANTALTADTFVSITRSHRVFVEADQTRRMLDVQQGTVADALKAAEVTLGGEDTVTPPLETALQNGMRIRVARYTALTITADGETKAYTVAARTVGDAVQQAGIELQTADRLSTENEDGALKTVDAATVVTEDMHIRVTRITTEETVTEEEIPFETSYTYDGAMYEDEKEIHTAGVAGSKRVTYKVILADGEEESREALKEEVLTEPQAEVVTVGTKKRDVTTGAGSTDGTTGSTGGAATGSTFVDASGKTVSYAWSITGSCTAYYGGGITSIGKPAQVGYVAVDPNIIPYGTLLYITSPYGTWDYGYCYAMDTGGAAMAGDIVADLYYDTYDECVQFGRRDMTVYIIG